MSKTEKAYVLQFRKQKDATRWLLNLLQEGWSSESPVVVVEYLKERGAPPEVIEEYRKIAKGQ